MAPRRRDIIECAAHGRAQVSHLPDVVQADVPLIAGPVKGVGEPSSLIVALEDENAPARVTGEQDGGSEPAHAGADDDGVPVFREAGLFVGCADGHDLLPRCRDFTE